MTDILKIREYAQAIIAETDTVQTDPPPPPPATDPAPIPGAPPAPPIASPPIVGQHAVTSLVDLMDKVRDMTGGGTIEVKAGVGSYGQVMLSAKPSAELKIVGAGGHFERIRVVSSRNITLEALDVWPLSDVVYSKGAHAYLIEGDAASESISVIGCDLRSTLQADQFINWKVADWKRHQISGVYLKGQRGLVQGCCGLGLYFGYNIAGPGCSLIENRVDGFMADALRTLGDGGSAIGNWATNAFNMNGNHPDGLQAFQSGNTLDGLTIDDNLLIEWTDMALADHPNRARLQNIGLHNGPYATVKVRRNVVAGSSANAVHFNRVQGLEVRDLAAFTQPGPKGYASRIRIAGSGGATVAGLYADKIVGASGGKIDNTKLAPFLVAARKGAARPDLAMAF